MSEEVLTKIESENIILIFDVGDKKYAALKDPNNTSNADIYFAVITNDKQDRNIFTNFPETDMEKVVEEFKKNIEFINSEDESDTFEEEEE